MKKEFMEYINKERNAVKDEFIISREGTSDSEFVYINHPEVDRPLYRFWHAYKKEKRFTGQRKRQVGNAGDKKKVTTGGKPMYVKLMLKEIGKKVKEGLSYEALGLFMYLCNYGLEWGTGKVCRDSRYSRYRNPVKVEDIARYCGIGIIKTKKIIKELREYGMIEYRKNERAYFLSKEIVMKGVVGRS